MASAAARGMGVEKGDTKDPVGVARGNSGTKGKKAIIPVRRDSLKRWEEDGEFTPHRVPSRTKQIQSQVVFWLPKHRRSLRNPVEKSHHSSNYLHTLEVEEP